jgi:hypothetical protein
MTHLAAVAASSLDTYQGSTIRGEKEREKVRGKKKSEGVPWYLALSGG